MTQKINNIDLTAIDFDSMNECAVFHPQLGWAVHMTWCDNCKQHHMGWLTDVGFDRADGLQTLGFKHPDGETGLEQFQLFMADLTVAVGSEVDNCTIHFLSTADRERVIAENGWLDAATLLDMLQPPITAEFRRLTNYYWERKIAPEEKKVPAHVH